MANLDRTIHALEICTSGDCHLGVCPLYSVPDCTFILRTESLELLQIMKENLPRPLTLEEVRQRKPFHLWAEDHLTSAILFPVALVDGFYRDAAGEWFACPDETERREGDPDSYGVTFRFWTGKPSLDLLRQYPLNIE